MGRIPEATIQEIRDRVDIVGLVGRYVELKQSGRNWKGLCPFHDEKTPSFNVNPERGIFHCFGCHEGGDAISFLIKHENLTYPEAVRALADDLGITIPETGGRGEGAGRGELEGIRQALGVAQRSYRDALRGPEGEAAREYLSRRGLAADVIERFGLGFVPDRWDTVASAIQRAGLSGEVGAKAGLLNARSTGGFYDRLRGRITFPIQDVRGRVIAFGGRALAADQEPKYLNTPESAVYHKRRAFYGFPHALEPMRRQRRVVVCEGYFDAIALHRAGIAEAVATCGTALTPEHAEELRRRRVDHVVLLFDGDAAGEQAMERALDVLLRAGHRVRAAQLPAGQDPDDFLTASGAEALRERIDRAPDAIERVLRRAMMAGCTTPTEKADAVRHVAPIVAAVAGPVERAEYTRRLAVATGTDPAAVEAVVRRCLRGGSAAADPEIASTLVQPRSETRADQHVRQIAMIVSRHSGQITDELCTRMHEVLPESPWKRLIFSLMDAAADGCTSEDGSIDHAAMRQRLDEADMKRLSELLVDETLDEHEMPPVDVLLQLVSHYEVKRLEAEQRESTRRLSDPDADWERILEEKQALLERKRAAAGIAQGTAPRP